MNVQQTFFSIAYHTTMQKKTIFDKMVLLHYKKQITQKLVVYNIPNFQQ